MEHVEWGERANSDSKAFARTQMAKRRKDRKAQPGGVDGNYRLLPAGKRMQRWDQQTSQPTTAFKSKEDSWRWAHPPSRGTNPRIECQNIRDLGRGQCFVHLALLAHPGANTPWSTRRLQGGRRLCSLSEPHASRGSRARARLCLLFKEGTGMPLSALPAWRERPAPVVAHARRRHAGGGDE